MQDRIDELVPAVSDIPATPTSKFVAADKLAQRGFSAFDRMMDLAEELEEADENFGSPVNAKLRLSIYKELAKYESPQPKAIDINLTKNENYTISAVSFKDLHDQRKHMIPSQSVYDGPSLKMSGVIEAGMESMDDDD